MALDPTPVFDDVLARVQSVIGATKVYVAEVPEDKDIPVVNALPVPFVSIYFGGPVRSSRDRHITTSRNDTTVLFFTVQAYAPRADIARTIKGRIIEGLTGYRPVDGGEMILAGGNTCTRASNEVRPTQFLEEVQFTCRSNLSWNEL